MKARKRFGQHFLNDKYILQRFFSIIAPRADDHLVEIGPGHGALTDYLMTSAQQIDVIEIDRDLVPLLEKKYGDRITIHQADALTVDFHQLSQQKKLRIIGNLPYNISTPLLFHLFKQIDVIQDMYFLLQKEVVDRLCAKPATHDYGRLSVMTQFYCTATALFTVPAKAFNPPPRVQSTFVRLIPHKDRFKVNSLSQFQSIVREAFNYRRKTLSNSLKRWTTAQHLQSLGIDPKKRPQELCVKDYIRISNSIEVE